MNHDLGLCTTAYTWCMAISAVVLGGHSTQALPWRIWAQGVGALEHQVVGALAGGAARLAARAPDGEALALGRILLQRAQRVLLRARIKGLWLFRRSLSGESRARPAAGMH